MLRTVVATIGLLLACTASYAQTDPAIGTWQTEAADHGGYLHVKIDYCGDKLCGTIIRAFDKDGREGDDYEHLGKLMIKNMRITGSGKYSKGTIWAPDANKTYKSKMKLSAEKLTVKGCIAFICRSQIWQQVK